MENSIHRNTQTHIALSPKEVATYLGKSLSWVYKNQNLLGVRKLGGSLFFPKKEELYERLFCKEKRMEIRLHPKRNKAHQGMVQTETRSQKGRIMQKGGSTQSSTDDPNRHGLLGISE